jgi:hypothetical protein
MGKDVIMLLIEQIAMVLAYALNLHRAGMDEEALQTVDELLDPLFDGSPDDIEVSRMADLLREMHADGPTVLGVVRLFHQRGEILSNLRDDRCFAMYPKALRLALACLPASEWQGAADLLYDLYRQSELSENERVRLFEGMEGIGGYAYAEDILYDFVEADPENRARGLAFYDRLLALDDKVLIEGGLPREEVLEGKAALENE